MDYSKMKEVFNWDSNPFSFKIMPGLFVGYSEELTLVLHGINGGDKFILLLGPTGSGKTTLLKHVIGRFEGRKIIYIPKPPKDANDWVGVFREVFKRGLLDSLLRRKDDTDLYNLSSRLNSRLNGHKCILFVDECHEASMESLEWLRTITDQVENLTLVMGGLPVFENILKGSLETFLRRFSVRVDLSSLTQAEMREMIKRRVESAGGSDTRPFTPETLDYVYKRTGGFPRDVLKVCNDLASKAVVKGLTSIDPELLKDAEIPERVSLDSLESLPSRQKMIIDTLCKHGELTPTDIVESNRASGAYKDSDNAIRSVNNLLRRLMSDGFVERSKLGKAYKYRLAPRYQTLMVKA